MTLRWPEPHIMPVYSKIIVLVGGVGFIRTNTTYNTTGSAKLILTPQR